MNRQEFLSELENLLQNIPNADRQEAIRYYEDYFEDAGIENEEHVIRELGSPEQVAAIIQEDLRNEATKDSGEFTEKGYYNPAFDKKNQEEVARVETPNYQNANQNANYNTSNGFGNEQQEKEPTYVYEYTKFPKTLFILAIIFFIPVGIPLIATAFAFFITMVALVFALVATFGGISFGLTLGGVLAVIGGISQFLIFPMEALMAVGVGLLLIGIGLLFAIMTKASAVLIPKSIRGFVYLCKLPFRRRAMA
ncbi:DUF1700 domain-containing protein [Anaerosporobacter sp.]|uniref:DUF1700 domain-containing protein n=1 Tax=Anaerosporobacter sp. TaxID=1872529 RepID=UPI00286F1CB0|nr:DUF1700 domain-containing protein [Anaerosporobacter sp.]